MGRSAVSGHLRVALNGSVMLETPHLLRQVELLTSPGTLGAPPPLHCSTCVPLLEQLARLHSTRVILQSNALELGNQHPSIKGSLKDYETN